MNRQNSFSTKRTFHKILKFLLKSLVVCLLLPIPVIIIFRWIDPPASAYIMQHKISMYFSDESNREIDYQWVDMENISPNLAIAVIASEDQKFPEHFGFDFESIKKAFSSKRKKMRGASTITQQVARNLFLWPGRSWLRKSAEVYLTFLIEVLWSKHRILEVYLNYAQFGKYIYGAESASKYFFNKPAKKINRNQAALMAAVLPNPVRFRIERPSNYIQNRTVWIKIQIAGLGGTGYIKDIIN